MNQQSGGQGGRSICLLTFFPFFVGRTCSTALLLKACRTACRTKGSWAICMATMCLAPWRTASGVEKWLGRGGEGKGGEGRGREGKGGEGRGREGRGGHTVHTIHRARVETGDKRHVPHQHTHKQTQALSSKPAHAYHPTHYTHSHTQTVYAHMYAYSYSMQQSLTYTHTSCTHPVSCRYCAAAVSGSSVCCSGSWLL